MLWSSPQPLPTYFPLEYIRTIFFYMLLLWGNIAKLALGYGCHSGVMESTSASPWVFMLGARAWTWQHFTVLVTEFVTSYLLCCCLDFDRKVTKKRQDQLRIGNKAPRVWLTYKRQGNGCSLTLCPPPPSPHCSLMHSTAQYSAAHHGTLSFLATSPPNFLDRITSSAGAGPATVLQTLKMDRI